MIRRWSRRAVTISLACLFLAIVFPHLAYAAARSSQDGLTGVMLTDGDLPPGFRPYAPLTGPLNAQRGKLLGISASNVSKIDSLGQGWVRDWISTRTGEAAYELAFDVGTRENAQSEVASFDATVLKGGFVKEPVPGPMHFAAFRMNGHINGIPYQTLGIALARGPYFFALYILAPTRSAASGSQVAGILAAAQWRKVPGNTPDTATSSRPDPFDTAGEEAGGVFGTLLIYLGMVNLAAYFRDPLRKARRRGRPGNPWRSPGEFDVRDVSRFAEYDKGIAFFRFVVQLIGVMIAAVGADVFVVSYWYLYVIAGLAVVWAGGRFIHPGGLGRTKNLAVLGGSHRVLVVSMLSVASATVFLGLALLVMSALANSQSQGSAQSQGNAQSFEVVGFVLVALGAVTHRFARRLGSIRADRLMQRDARAPVLYLRSFGDDRLKLWTATLGRISFIERFSPRRFDSFEEVLVRYLSLRGPVVAVNLPGSRLPPLGAARATLGPDDWQATVAAWMEKSAEIVFVAPPEQIHHGLLWELKTVTASKHWDKTIIVVPPVPPQDLARRWQGFRYVCGTLWPFTFPLPTDITSALLLTFRSDRWTVTIADRKSEWSYSAALTLLDDSLQPGHAPSVQLTDSPAIAPEAPGRHPG